MFLDYPEVTNWAILSKEEIGKMCLSGKIWNSKKFEDGTEIITSRIMDAIYEQGCIIIKTRNSIYKIQANTVDPEYEKAFPNAWERLLLTIGV